MREVVWFSNGAASAVAAFLSPGAEIVYCDTFANEHHDNRRFFSEVQAWCGREIRVLRSKKYRSVEEVWIKERWMSGPRGAKCTTELKKLPRFDFSLPDDVNIFGFTVEEKRRISEFEARNPDLLLRWPLRDAGLTKADCFRFLLLAGIELPLLYRLGFKNNNCIGCCKASSPAYWNLVRHHFPDVFRQRAILSRELGCKLVEVKRHQRIFLDELPVSVQLEMPTESNSCGPECGDSLSLSKSHNSDKPSQ